MTESFPGHADYVLGLADDALVSAQRMAHKRRAHDEGAWVREAAAAYAAKRAATEVA